MNIRKLIQVAVIAIISINGSLMAMSGKPGAPGRPVPAVGGVPNANPSSLLNVDHGRQPRGQRRQPTANQNGQPNVYPTVAPRLTAGNTQQRREGEIDILDLSSLGANQPGQQPRPRTPVVNRAPVAAPVNGVNAQAQQPAALEADDSDDEEEVVNQAGYATQAGQKIDSVFRSIYNCISNFCVDMYASAHVGYDNAQQRVTTSRPATFATQHGRKILYGLAGIVGLYTTYRLGSGLYNMGFNSGHTSGLVEGIQTIKSATQQK